MNTMKRIAMLAGAALVLAACGGGGGPVPAMPEAPAVVQAPAAVPVAEPEGEGEPVVVMGTKVIEQDDGGRYEGEVNEAGQPHGRGVYTWPDGGRYEGEWRDGKMQGQGAETLAAPVFEPVPVAEAPVDVARDPATLLQSHDRLSLPEGFTAVQADEAMFLLANIPYSAPQGGGGGLAAASFTLQAGALALYAAERSAAYTPDHAVLRGPWIERVLRVKPGVTTHVTRGAYAGYEFASFSGCNNSREECRILHPHPALSEATNPPDAGASGRLARAPIADMPFVGDAMRDSSEGVRSRGGVDFRYWATSGDVPWLRYRHKVAAEEYATETWSGYGAWQQWSGFGLVMLAHNHQWDLYDSAWHHWIAGGDLTGSLPEVTGTMRGAAVAQADDLGTFADGTATMTVRLGANPSLDISIGDWQGYNLTARGEIGRPTAVSIPDIVIGNIPINADGTFAVNDYEWRDKAGGVLTPPAGYTYPRASDHDSAIRWWRDVSGAFYGPGGGEAAGVFSTTRSEYRAPSGSQQWEGISDIRVNGAFGVRKPKTEVQ